MHQARSNLADVVTDPKVARLLDDLRVALPRLHGDMRVVESAMDLRAEFRGELVCRVVPYRELLHVQVGEEPMWEARIRSTREFPHVIDRIVRAFLRVYARSRPGPAGAGGA